MPTGLSLIETEIDSDDPNQKKKGGGSAGWLGTDQLRGRHWIWKMGRMNRNSGPVDRGKQVRPHAHRPWHSACDFLRLWKVCHWMGLCGLHTGCSVAGWEEASWAPSAQRTRKRGECATHQDDTQQEKSVPIPWKEAGISSEGNERYLTKKQKQASQKPVSTTMSKTLYKREPEIWKSI